MKMIYRAMVKKRMIRTQTRQHMLKKVGRSRWQRKVNTCMLCSPMKKIPPIRNHGRALSSPWRTLQSKRLRRATTSSIGNLSASSRVLRSRKWRKQARIGLSRQLWTECLRTWLISRRTCRTSRMMSKASRRISVMSQITRVKSEEVERKKSHFNSIKCQREGWRPEA